MGVIKPLSKKAFFYKLLISQLNNFCSMSFQWVTKNFFFELIFFSFKKKRKKTKYLYVKIKHRLPPVNSNRNYWQKPHNPNPQKSVIIFK